MSTWKISQWSMRFVADFPRDNVPPHCYSQIGEVEGSKTDLPDPDTTEREEVAPLDKVIIKKREKKEDRKSTEGRDLG